MKPSLSPLRLDQYYVKNAQFSLAEEFDDLNLPLDDLKIPDLRIEVISALQNPENENQWRFDLQVELPKSSEERFPYSFSTTVVGYFTLDGQYPRESAELVVRSNAPALLYSSARDFVLGFTSRSLYNPFLLPSVTFVSSAHEATAKQVAPANKTSKITAGSKKKAAKKR